MYINVYVYIYMYIYICIYIYIYTYIYMLGLPDTLHSTRHFTFYLTPIYALLNTTRQVICAGMPAPYCGDTAARPARILGLTWVNPTRYLFTFYLTPVYLILDTCLLSTSG